MFETIDIKNLHHAYAFEGSEEYIVSELNSFIEGAFQTQIQGNPDYRLLQYETLGIDEARFLQDLQLGKSISGNKKFYLVSFGGITIEAQNALLKVFEEPTPDTHFFLILNSFESLIPTLQSRLFLVSQVNADKKEITKIGEDFVSRTIADRNKMIESIAESKNKLEARELLDSIEIALEKKLHKKHTPEIIFALEEVLRAKQYLEDRSPSIKLLLDHIASVTPVY